MPIIESSLCYFSLIIALHCTALVLLSSCRDLSVFLLQRQGLLKLVLDRKHIKHNTQQAHDDKKNVVWTSMRRWYDVISRLCACWVELESNKVRPKAKIRNPFNQIPHLTQDTIWESVTNTRKHHIQERQEVSPFPAGDHKAASNKHDSLTQNTNNKNALITRNIPF